MLLRHRTDTLTAGCCARHNREKTAVCTENSAPLWQRIKANGISRLFQIEVVGDRNYFERRIQVIARNRSREQLLGLQRTVNRNVILPLQFGEDGGKEAFSKAVRGASIRVRWLCSS
jgi:hypothetical protein